ncbi:MAG: glycosyltransferase family 4 protein [Akkermansiaceae bacterium]|nr:glycosyltransferase family 4 protein [Armatimonadota bacterium]
MTHNFAFVLDQQVGLRTQSLNIERVVRADESITPTFVPVRYDAERLPLLARLPGVPKSVSGTLAGIREIRRGMSGKKQDGVLWATWAAKSVPDLVSTAPACLLMDMTPVQMESMGELYGYGPSRAAFLSGWKRKATARLYQESVHLFAWSEWVAQSLRDDYGISPEKVTTVAPGVDVSLFCPDPEQKPDDGVVRLLFVGGDFCRKGGDLLLRWAKQTRVRTPWELHLVTRDVQSDLPRGVFAHYGIANNSPELVRLYQQSDLFVLPTRADCFSLVSIEAMASGLPVICSDLGGIPEIVAEGETGMLVAPDDFDALASRLDCLIESQSLRERMSQASRARALSFFDARHNVGRILTQMRKEVVA